MLGLFITHFWQYFYFPAKGPWYAGSVWGNVFVAAIIFPLGYIWSKLKWWPLKPMEHLTKGLHTKLDGHIQRQHEHNELIQKHAEHQTKLTEEMHHLAYTGKPHPRVKERLDAGEKHTPSML